MIFLEAFTYLTDREDLIENCIDLLDAEPTEEDLVILNESSNEELLNMLWGEEELLNDNQPTEVILLKEEDYLRSEYDALIEKIKDFNRRDHLFQINKGMKNHTKENNRTTKEELEQKKNLKYLEKLRKAFAVDTSVDELDGLKKWVESIENDN